jgi:general nucleoside transport system permease protein
MNTALLGSISAIFTNAAPVIFALIGETLTERAGVINLSLNGSILLTAMVGFAAAFVTQNFLIGFLAAALVGALVALIVAFFSITLKQSQVAVGYVLTLTCKSLAYFLGAPYIGAPVLQLPLVKIPLLSDIPILGPILFSHNVMVYISYVLIFVAFVWIFRTRGGLVLRGVGERPAAAFIRGANVNRIRYLYTGIGGALVGIAGAIYSLSVKPGWAGQLSGLDGVGWIVLAITIFGAWNPIRGSLGAYFFAFLQQLGISLQQSLPNVNFRIFQVAPFPLMILTLLFVNIGNAEWVQRTLAGLPDEARKIIARILRSLRTNPPAALGTPFENE